MFSFTRTRRPPVLLFDYDGVIVDSFDVYYREFKGICRQLGYLELNSREQFLNLFDGNLVRRLIKAGFPLRKLKQLARQLAPRLETVNAGIEPFAGMPETLARLSARHPLLIITANHSETVSRFLHRYELNNVRAVIGTETDTSKIRKIRTARRLFPDHRPYYIGDTRGDMREARRARAVPVGVGWGWHTPERLRAGGAAHIVMTQEALIKLITDNE